MVDGGGARLLPVILDSRRYFQFVLDCNFRWKLKSGVMVIFTCSQTTEVPVIEGLGQAKPARQGLQEEDLSIVGNLACGLGRIPMRGSS